MHFGNINKENNDPHTKHNLSINKSGRSQFMGITVCFINNSSPEVDDSLWHLQFHLDRPQPTVPE